MSRPVSSRRRRSQGGYVLLMVFLMAAIIALMLYQQLPRVAFETEREKEQLLIDRGEQYTRAIQLYYLANNRQYPTSIDDLEKKEKRFLRRRYVDPYTGKDEWRIIHTNGGFLTDSLVQKPPTAGDGQSQNASNTPSNPANTSPTDGQPQVNAAVLQRPSDRPLTPPGGFGQPFPVQDPSAQPNPPQNNGPLPPITLQPQQGPGALPSITLQAQQGPGALPPITLLPGGGNQPGLPPITLTTPTVGGQQNPGQTPGQIPGQIPGQLPGQLPGQPGQLRTPQVVPGQGGVVPFPGQPGPGGLPGSIQTGVPPGFRMDANGQLVPNTPGGAQILGQGGPGQPPGGLGLQPGIPIPGQPFSPQQPGNQPLNQAGNQPGGEPGAPNAALNLINQLLTNPRQAGSTPVVSGGNQVGAIAGIASTHKGPSIKVYKDQNQYELWEFVFSPTASTVPGAGAPPATPGVAPAGGTAPSTGAPSGTSQSPFGNSFGTNR